jgi:ABC-type sugar transport system ATPase subunit
MEADLSYFRRRAVEEIRAAELSADGYVRRIHLELSRQYEQRVAKLEAEVRRAQIHVVDAD